MSALRLSDYRTGEVRLVDLGPGVASGRIHDGGRLARPEDAPTRDCMATRPPHRHPKLMRVSDEEIIAALRVTPIRTAAARALGISRTALVERIATMRDWGVLPTDVEDVA